MTQKDKFNKPRKGKEGRKEEKEEERKEEGKKKGRKEGMTYLQSYHFS